MKIGAIVQARLASSRLPEKVVKQLPNGKLVVEQVVDNLKDVVKLSTQIVAIPREEEHSALAAAVLRTSAKLFLGEATDVLSRYYHAAKEHQLDIILRITADDPVRDATVESNVIETLLNNETLDYVKTIGLPEGLNTEAFRMRALERAYQEACLASEREHVTPYIWKNEDMFSCHIIKYNCLAREKYRLTLDSPEDWQMFQALFAVMEENVRYDYAQLLALLDMHPDIYQLNNMLQEGSGYLKSLAEDHTVR